MTWPKGIAEIVLTSDKDRQHYFFSPHARGIHNSEIYSFENIIMCYYVYIISSENLGRFYVGQTRNVSKRIFEHNQALSTYTSTGIPWHLECVIHKATLEEALTLERKLKNLSRARKIRFIQKYGTKINNC